MYSALELHKEIFQGLQTVDAFTQDMFLPEELDFHLNKQQDNFINELLDEGFADRQIRLDYIQNLIVKNKSLPVYISPLSFYYESGAVTSLLPGNYKHHLSTRVKVRKTADCAALVENDTEVSYYMTTVKLETKLTTSPYYSKVEFIRIEENNDETLLASLTNDVTQEKSDINNIMRKLVYEASKESNTVEYYLGKYADSVRQGNTLADNAIQIITPVNTQTYKIITYTIDGSIDKESLGVGTDVDNTSFTTRTTETWDLEATDAGGVLLNVVGEPKITPTELLDNKEVYERQQNVFYFPKPDNPHTLIADGIIFNYYGNSFLVEEAIIDYIRNPQLISLADSKGCELSESAARLIANRTIEYLKLAIENPSYREVLQHNEIRESK